MKPSELLSRPGAWCQGSMAKDKVGQHVGSHSKKAVQWCAMGAIQRCTWSVYREAALIERLRRVLGDEPIGPWNDAPERTKRQVVAALRKAGL